MFKKESPGHERPFITSIFLRWNQCSVTNGGKPYVHSIIHLRAWQARSPVIAVDGVVRVVVVSSGCVNEHGGNEQVWGPTNNNRKHSLFPISLFGENDIVWQESFLRVLRRAFDTSFSNITSTPQYIHL